MSRAHCELELVGNAITLRDLSSSSGTLVDGNTVAEKQIEIGSKNIGWHLFYNGVVSPPAFLSHRAAKTIR